MKTVAIIQARMRSTRFPGKVMKKINGIPILQWMIERVYNSERIGKIVIATTPDSTEIHDLCYKYKYPMYVGSEEDVLQRVYHCALTHYADIIVDLTSDCPLVDFRHIDTLVNMVQSEYSDKPSRQYASNIRPRLMFDGADIQVYTKDVLKIINDCEFSYRQHSGYNAIIHSDIDTNMCITPNDPKHQTSHIRLTLDYSEDFESIKNVINYLSFLKPSGYNSLYDNTFSYDDICDLILARPELLTNTHLISKQPGEK